MFSTVSGTNLSMQSDTEVYTLEQTFFFLINSRDFRLSPNKFPYLYTKTLISFYWPQVTQIKFSKIHINRWRAAIKFENENCQFFWYFGILIK